MFESIMNMMKKITKKEDQTLKSKDAAKERLHLVLMQDRANVSADFLDLMKQEIIEVIKKYIDIDEAAMDVRLTNKDNGDGTNGAPALYANIPIINIKDEIRQNVKSDTVKQENEELEKDCVLDSTIESNNDVSGYDVNSISQIESNEIEQEVKKEIVEEEYIPENPKVEEIKITESSQENIQQNNYGLYENVRYNEYNSKKNKNKKNKKHRRK